MNFSNIVFIVLGIACVSGLHVEKGNPNLGRDVADTKDVFSHGVINDLTNETTISSNIVIHRSKRQVQNFRLGNGQTVAVDWQTNRGGCRVPKSFVTTIIRSNLNINANGRSDFTRAEHNRRMTEMNAMAGDDKGHILASALGGPAENWNLFPQACRLNRGPESEPHETNIQRRNWKGVERRMNEFVRQETGNSVRLTVYFDYYDRTGSCRPYDVQMTAILVPARGATENIGGNYVNDNFGYHFNAAGNCIPG